MTPGTLDLLDRLERILVSDKPAPNPKPLKVCRTCDGTSKAPKPGTLHDLVPCPDCTSGVR